MKSIFAAALSLAALSLFADTGTDIYSRASLFGENEMPVEKQKRLVPERPSDAVYLFSPVSTVELGFTALILQPTASNLHYAAEAHPLPAPSPHWTIHDIHPSHEFGFDLALSGNFASTNSNLSLDWEHFRSHDSASTTVDPSDMIGPFFEIGPDGTPYKKARGRVKFEFDQVNLDYGVFVQFGSRLQTNLFGGIGVAVLKQDLSTKFSDLSGGVQRSIKTPSKFVGAGPRFGMKFCYKLYDGLKLDGGIATDFFVGNLKNHTSYESNSPFLPGLGITPPNDQSTSVSKRAQIVPALEGFLCLAYMLVFREHFTFRVAAGYQAQFYFNAIQSVDIGSEVVTPPVVPDTVGVFARTFQRTLSNFGLSGPFVNVTLGF